jgi:hypothetical protein
MNRTRSIPELLAALPSLDPTLFPEGAISREELTLSSSPSDVKKAYLRAIRLVHPDKLVGKSLSPLPLLLLPAHWSGDRIRPHIRAAAARSRYLYSHLREV